MPGESGGPAAVPPPIGGPYGDMGGDGGEKPPAANGSGSPIIVLPF